MAIRVKALAEVVKKWAQNAQTSQQYYQSGVAGAANDWFNAAINSGAAFRAGISAGNIEQLFVGGIRRATAEKYNRKATGVGVQRFSAGVAAATQDYNSGIEPMLATIAGITLGARGPRGSAVNIQRVSQIADALHAKRLALRAAGA